MNNDSPEAVSDIIVFKIGDMNLIESSKEEPDLDLLEIEEAKKLFDEQYEADAYWAGRLLADRKSTRIAA
jgi:hypothetical protein